MKGLFQDIRLFKISEESQQRAGTLREKKERKVHFISTQYALQWTPDIQPTGTTMMAHMLQMQLQYTLLLFDKQTWEGQWEEIRNLAPEVL